MFHHVPQNTAKLLACLDDQRKLGAGALDDGLLAGAAVAKPDFGVGGLVQSAYLVRSCLRWVNCAICRQ